MTLRPLAILALAGLFGAGCGNTDKVSDNEFTGKYFLAECPSGSVAPDAIEFRPDGSCLVDASDHIGIAGKYETTAEGHLTIEADTGEWKEFNAPYELGKYTLTLQPNNETMLIYVKMPEGSRPQFDEILGIFSAHNELGDSAGGLTADHKFLEHLHDLDPDEYTYYDIHMDGTFSYSNGIVTYLPEHSDAPQQDKYLRDFIIKRDGKGLWQIDAYHDSIICERPATNLDLPPVPDGYHKASKL